MTHTALEPEMGAGSAVRDSPSRTTIGPDIDIESLLALTTLSREVGFCADLDSLLQRIEATALRVLRCERLTVFVREPVTDDLHSRLATGAVDIRTPSNRGIAAATCRDARVINVREAAADPRFYDEIDRRTGYRTRSVLSVPLRGIINETIGVLQLLNKGTGRFTTSDEEVALTLGSLTGITLQRQMLTEHFRAKQRLERDLRLGRYIQRTLLPPGAPRLPGYDVAAVTEAVAVTGGDFYDYLELPDGRLGLVVADVAGHGFAASLLACEARALIRSAAVSARSLAEIAAGANALLYRDLRHERFVVLFLGALDAASGRIEYVGAGCAPQIFRAAGRCAEIVEATVPPLGILPRLPEGASAVLCLEPGDVLVMATDGLYEWENAAAEPFGLTRLQQAVAAHAGGSADEVIRGLYDGVRRFAAGVAQVDDLTAMVVARSRR